MSQLLTQTIANISIQILSTAEYLTKSESSVAMSTYFLILGFSKVLPDRNMFIVQNNKGKFFRRSQ